MKTITKSLLVLGVLASALTLATPASAYSGIYGFGIELNASGAQATNQGTTLYGLADGGDARLIPTGSSATVSTAWTTDAASPTFNLGTFTTADTLTLKGGSMLTYQGSGDSVSGGYLDYNVVPVGNRSGSFTALQLNLNSSDPSNNGGGDQRFALESNTVNLLTGLAPGTYELETFGFAPASNGTQFINGDGNNYGATFTVIAAPVGVPEPSVWATMLIGLATLVGVRRFRQLSQS